MAFVNSLPDNTRLKGVRIRNIEAMGFGRDVRSAIFRTVESFSQTEINAFGTASLITRNTNDVQQVQMLLVIALSIMILAPITAVGGVIMALRQDVGLAWLIVTGSAEHTLLAAALLVSPE